MQSQHLLVDQRRPGSGQRGDVLRAVPRHYFDVRLHLCDRRAAPAGNANPVVMMSDTVDYGEWTNGKRLTGISFAGTLFVLKLGLALGGAMIGWMLAGGGYDAAAKTQNSATISIIVGLFTLAPAVCLCAERLYRQTLLHAENAIPDQNHGRAGRRARAATSRSLRTCRSAKNYRTKRTIR